MSKVHTLFLLFALPYGIMLLLLLPPLGGNDEGFHFQRIATIAYHQPLNKVVAVPKGIKTFIDSGSDFFREGLQPPFNYSKKEFETVGNIPLEKDKIAFLVPNYFTVHHPFCYIPQVIAFRIGVYFNARPLYLLYMCRAASLLASMLLLYFTFSILPSHRYCFAALAFLPSAVFYRSNINPDAFTNGLAFLFCALLYSEIAKTEKIHLNRLITLGLIGFVQAQCKNAYLPLLFLAFAIPKERFTHFTRKILCLFFMLVPAILASIAWIVLSKQSFFTGLSYPTLAGYANPDQQIAYVLQHPLLFVMTLLRTLFATDFFMVTALQLFGDAGPGTLIPLILSMLIAYLFLASMLSVTTSVHLRSIRLLCSVIAFAALLLILSLIYIHWNSVAAPVIIGAHGRYLTPLLPLLLPFLAIEKRKMSLSPDHYLIMLAFTVCNAEIWQVAKNYY